MKIKSIIFITLIILIMTSISVLAYYPLEDREVRPTRTLNLVDTRIINNEPEEEDMSVESVWTAPPPVDRLPIMTVDRQRLTLQPKQTETPHPTDSNPYPLETDSIELPAYP